MKCNFDIEDAIRVVRTAFHPYECDLRVYDHGRQVAFRVLDLTGNLLYSQAGIDVPDILNHAKLRATIERARQQIRLRGCDLTPWTPPDSI
jgi:hypothetical protein